MFQTYSYNKQDEVFNAIIETASEQVKQNMAGSTKSATYDEDKKALNLSIMKYALEGTRWAEEYAGRELEAAKDPRVKKNATFKENFNLIVAEIINVAAPMVSAPKYNDFLADVVQVGFGDTAVFQTTSNALFKVNEIAEGINRGVLQPMYNDEYTVNCTPVEIATAINWYQIAAGVFDFGYFGWKAAKSFESYIFLKMVAAMTSATAQVGAGYSASGMSDQNWDNLAQRVRAANGGAEVYAIGTIGALGKVLPANNYLQIGLGEESAKEGFLNKYHTVPLIGVPNVLKPLTINTTADLAIVDNKIYMVGAENYKPVKIVFEGNSIVIEEIPEESSDRMYGMKIELRLGISAIVGSKFATLTLNA